MDDQVKRAMAKWPSVPAVYGWLRLGRRGSWFLIDRQAPGFDPLRDRGGSLITSPALIAFIRRNYESDGRGAWFFQNGPQRVFVELDIAPLIVRVIGEGDARALVTQTQVAVARIEAALFDRDGNLFLKTDCGPALVDDRDLVRMLDDEGGGHGQAGGGGATPPVEQPLRLALPRYGLALEWSETLRAAAPTVPAIAAQLGYQLSPVP